MRFFDEIYERLNPPRSTPKSTRRPARLRVVGIIAVMAAILSTALWKVSSAEENNTPPPPALWAVNPVVKQPAAPAAGDSSDGAIVTATDSPTSLDVHHDAEASRQAVPAATTPSDEALSIKSLSDGGTDQQAQSPKPDDDLPSPIAKNPTRRLESEQPLRIPLVDQPEPQHVSAPATDARSTLDTDSPAAGDPIGAETNSAATAPRGEASPYSVDANIEKLAAAAAKAIRFGTDLPLLPIMEVAPAYFRGVQPGATTRAELIRQWGDATPGRRSDGSSEWLYAVPPYPKVTVTLSGQIVATITAKLKEPVDSHVLMQRLKLKEGQGLPVVDDAGIVLGSAFPEKGLLLSYAPGTQTVSEMLLETIDPEPFLARAALEQLWHPQRSLRDVDFALKLDPKSGRAYDLRAEILMQAGRLGEALQAADKATHCDPQNSAYTLVRAEILGRLDRATEAVRMTKSVVEQADLPPALKAQALCQLGDLMLGAMHEDKQALEFHLAAIKAAEPLIADAHQAVRRQAKHVLLDAHLRRANDIAWGVWQQKARVVPKWLAQASEIARDLIEHEDADPEVRLKVLPTTAAVGGGREQGVLGIRPDWIQLAQETGNTLLETTDDHLRRAWLEWELGVALSNLLEFESQRGLNDQTLGDAAPFARAFERGGDVPPTDSGRWLPGRTSLLPSRRDLRRAKIGSHESGRLVSAGGYLVRPAIAHGDHGPSRPSSATCL